MSIDFRSPRVLAPFRDFVDSYVYVMCGARTEERNPITAALPQARFIGFEPDPEECERLNRLANPMHTYYCAAVGEREEERTFKMTRDRSCSSLLEPNHEFFAKFLDCGSHVDVLDRVGLRTVSLDTYLASVGITSVDFMELDTQGTELEILRGASHFVRNTLTGLKVEAEFSVKYRDQPLFADVDSYLRGFGFMLFDLSRNRYRRTSLPRHIATRGQMLWGDAIYLRDYEWFTKNGGSNQLASLCVTAAALGFHDYALEVLEFVLRSGSESQRAAVRQARTEYLNVLENGTRGTRIVEALQDHGLRPFLRATARLGRLLDEVCAKRPDGGRFSWSD